MKLLILTPALYFSTLARAEKLQDSLGPATSPGDDFDCGFRTLKSVILKSFNLHRANHSAGPLEWNDTLAAAAVYTAQHGKEGVHDNNGTGWGQNMYMWYSSDASNTGIEAQAAVSSWYNDEFARYNAYGDASRLDLKNHPHVIYPPATPPGAVYGHLTQTIWKDTKTVGCGDNPHMSTDGKYYGNFVVCNFYPPGNYITSDESWVDNVLPPRGDEVLKILCGGEPIFPPNVDDPQQEL